MRTPEVTDLVKQTFSEWTEEAPRLGAALAYYVVFSIPPLLIEIEHFPSRSSGDNLQIICFGDGEVPLSRVVGRPQGLEFEMKGLSSRNIQRCEGAVDGSVTTPQKIHYFSRGERIAKQETTPKQIQFGDSCSEPLLHCRFITP